MKPNRLRAKTMEVQRTSAAVYTRSMIRVFILKKYKKPSVPYIYEAIDELGIIS